MTDEKLKKTKLSVIILLVVAILATAIIAVLSFGKSDEAYRTITVIEVTGTVGVVHNDTEYQAYTGMHLEEGYAVVTSGNSYIRLLLDDDKYVKLESGSKATFEEVRGGKTAIRIERGSIVAEVTRPLEIDEDFIVNTPNAVLAVRGTLFRVDLSRNHKGELNTDVMTYGGEVSSKRVQPDGKVEDIELTIKQGFKATVNMDDKETVYLVDDIKVDLSALVGTGNADTTITETNVNGGIVNTPITLESILKPIVIEDIPDEDLVDIYFASENGHSMFVETEEISEQIEKREIDITLQTSVYEVAEKIENPIGMVIPDDNIPLATTTEGVTEPVIMVQGPPTDGLAEITETTVTTTVPTTETTTNPIVSTTEPTTKPKVPTIEPTTEATTEPTTVHTHDEVTEEVKSTCKKSGKVIVKCSECGEVLTEKIIEKLGHIPKTTVNATCTGNGKIIEKCKVCGEVVSETILEKLGHKTETTTIDATCTEDGKVTEKCKVCGEVVSETILEKLGHKTETTTIDATCTVDGKKIEKCTVCGEIISETILEKLGHTTEKTTVNATCTGNGKIIEKCKVCGEVVSETILEKLGHKTETTTIDATCTEDGKVTEKCKVCGEVVSETILEKLGHKTETTTIDATCTVDGKKIEKCTVCGEIISETILEKLGHTTEITTVNATCTVDGKKIEKCTVCGEIISETILEKLGHTTEITTVNATCTEDGKKTEKCTVCSVIISETVITSTGHKSIYSGTQDAHTECEICHEILSTSHTYTTNTVDATCTQDGGTNYICECGYNYTDIIPQTGHTEINAGEPDAHTKCDVCGETLTDGTSHSYTDTETKVATCITVGELTHTCSCGWNYTEEIPAGHKKSDDGTTCSGCGEIWVDLNSTNFPDSMFLSYLSTTYDADGNNALIGDEVTGVVTINVSGDSQTDGGYTDLTGINRFTNLTTLNFAYNSSITELDLSGLSNLTSIDVTGLTNLETLDISGTALSESDITGFASCTKLKVLNVSNCANFVDLNVNNYLHLETVNLSNCTSLESFVINDNSNSYALSNITLDGCTSLKELTINNGLGLTSIDLSDADALEILDLGGCQGITGTLDLSGKSNLLSVTIGSLNKLTTLNVNGCTSLATLTTTACTSLTTLIGASSCTNLTTLILVNSGFTSLDLQSNDKLEKLNVMNCKSLTYLDLTRSIENTVFNSLTVTNCTALKTLNLYNCKGITSLVTTTLTALEELNLSYSGVKTFNSIIDTMSFSQNTNLKNVYLNGVTSFTGFDISENTALEEFSLTENSNALALDFSACTKLKNLTLSDVTGLTTLNIDNCNVLESLNVLNTGVNSLSVTGSLALTQVYVYNNSNLATLNITGASALTNVKLSAGTTNTALENLSITNSGLTSLDTTYLTGITTLNLSNTAITTLDLSACTNITSVNVTGNNMASGSVTLPGGKNESIVTGLV